MTHSALVDRAVRWLRTTRRCSIAYGEIATYAPLNPDAIGWGDCCVLVEVKVSRSDYWRDRHKPSHRADALPGSERWYLTPPGLIRPDELADGWGLIEAHPTVIRVRVPGSRLAPTPAGLRAEIAILRSVARRHEVGAPFDPVRGRFRPLADR